MPRVLLTSFGPYQSWDENSSWLTMIELTRNLPDQPEVVTRRYPVELAACQEKIAADLAIGFDYAIHLGQAPGSTQIQLESIALNIFSAGGERKKLAPNGPLAYETALPVDEWVTRLQGCGIPTVLSDHAGTYLCNALYYFSQHLAKTNSLPTQSLFIHLPLTTAQAVHCRQPSLPVEVGANAVHRIIDWIGESFG